MNFEEFLEPRNKKENKVTSVASVSEEFEQVEETNDVIETEEELNSEELDVQKAVVEALAADKAEQNERINTLLKENYKLKSEISGLNQKLFEIKQQMTNMADIMLKNVERPFCDMVTLLERTVELNDKFEGETRDHVIEVIREAREQAEKTGRTRRAQILESVLVANEETGNLKKKREQLKNLFESNQNILSGPVINSLDNLGISYKKGEEYLLPSEIMKATY